MCDYSQVWFLIGGILMGSAFGALIMAAFQLNRPEVEVEN